jgi:hypothetical protein
LVEHIGAENICPHVQAALARTRRVYENFSGVGEEVAKDLAKAKM